MNTKSPQCWASDPQARGLRVEISAEYSILLPHDQFAFCEVKSDGKNQTVRLVFATHEVLIRGHSLKRVETAMQRSVLSNIAALSGRQQSLIPDGEPVVLDIVVVEAKATEVGGWKTHGQHEP